MDKKFSIRQFPSPEHPYIAFPQKKLAVLDIARFTFCKVDYNHWYRMRMEPIERLQSWSSVREREHRLVTPPTSVHVLTFCEIQLNIA